MADFTSFETVLHKLLQNTGKVHIEIIINASPSEKACPSSSVVSVCTSSSDEPKPQNAESGGISLKIESTGEDIVLFGSCFSVGRSKDCSLTLNTQIQYKTISRHHLLIYIENGIWYLEDTDSKNGTKLNNRKLMSDEMYKLHDRDVISLGSAENLIFSTIPQSISA